MPIPLRIAISSVVKPAFAGTAFLLAITICALSGCRPGMARQQLVWMLPTRDRLDACEPALEVRIDGPVDADLVVEEQVAAHGNVGDGQAVADDKSASGEVRIENGPGRFGALAEFRHDVGIGVLRERAHEAVRRRV